jgi:hypothetical protein
VAEKSGLAIIPVGAAASRYWVLNTWDQMKIPKPFSNIYLVYGSPVMVPSGIRGAEFREYQTLVAKGINEAERRALSCCRTRLKS